MRHSVFLTIKLVILMNIFLIPFAVISENIIIRFIAGSLLGMSLIIFLLAMQIPPELEIKYKGLWNKGNDMVM